MKQIGIVAGIMVVLLLGTPTSIQATQYDAQAIPAATGITLTVDFGNGTVVNYTELSAPDVYNLTSTLLEVDAVWTGNRVFVNAIDGVSQDENHGWQFWVNGDYATIAANLFVLQDGDSVLWNRTISGFHSTTEPDLTLIVGGILLAFGGLVFLVLLYRKSIRR